MFVDYLVFSQNFAKYRGGGGGGGIKTKVKNISESNMFVDYLVFREISRKNE